MIDENYHLPIHYKNAFKLKYNTFIQTFIECYIVDLENTSERNGFVNN